jgi:hypothetical protein
MITLRDLAQKYSVPYSTLAGWIERELIEAHGRTGRSGSPVILNDKNVKEIENLIRLRKGGLSLQRARHLIEDLRATGYNPLSKGLFVVIDPRKGRVLRVSDSKRAAREVAGPHRQQTVMVELIPELADS